MSVYSIDVLAWVPIGPECKPAAPITPVSLDTLPLFSYLSQADKNRPTGKCSTKASHWPVAPFIGHLRDSPASHLKQC